MMKKTWKRISALILLSAMLLSLAACGGPSTSTNGSDTSPVTDNSPPTSEGATIHLRFAAQHNPETNYYKNDMATLEKIRERSGGRIDIEMFGNGQLGDATQVFDDVMSGTIDMAHISVNETYDARINAPMLPYMSTTYDDLEEIYGKGSWLSDKISEYEAALNLKHLAMITEGFAGVATTVPVTDPEVIGADKGVVVRVPGNDSFKLPTELLGYRTSSIPYSDTFSAIQTGVVQGTQSGAIPGVYIYWRDVLKYYYNYMMSIEATQVLMNMDVWNSLSAEDQEIIETAFKEDSEMSFETMRSEVDEYRQKIADETDIQIIDFTDEQRAEFAQAVRDEVWPQFEANYTKEFLDELRANLPE